MAEIREQTVLGALASLPDAERSTNDVLKRSIADPFPEPTPVPAVALDERRAGYDSTAVVAVGEAA